MIQGNPHGQGSPYGIVLYAALQELQREMGQNEAPLDAGQLVPSLDEVSTFIAETMQQVKARFAGIQEDCPPIEQPSMTSICE